MNDDAKPGPLSYSVLPENESERAVLIMNRRSVIGRFHDDLTKANPASSAPAHFRSSDVETAATPPQYYARTTPLQGGRPEGKGPAFCFLNYYMYNYDSASVLDVEARKAAAEAAEAALEEEMALCDCSNEEELLQLAMAVSIAAATAATPAPRVNIHGFPASGAPPANAHVRFPDAGGADANADDGEDDDDDDDDGDDRRRRRQR